MKIFKWIFLGILGVFVLLSLGSFIALATYDFTAAREDLARLSQALTGRRLVIRGGIRPTLGLRPGIEVDDLAFQNASWGSRPNMLTIRRLELKVAVLPIFRGEIRVHRLILDGPDLIIERSPQGLTNLPFTRGKIPVGPSGGKGGGMSFMPDLSLDTVTVTNGRLAVVNAKTHRRIDVGISRLSATVTGINNPVSIDMGASIFGKNMSVTGNLGSVRSLVDGSPWPIDVVIRSKDDEMTATGVIGDVLNVTDLNLRMTARIRRPRPLLASIGIPAVLIYPVTASGRLMRKATAPFALSEISFASGGSDLSGDATIQLDSPIPRVTATLTARTLDFRDVIAAARKQVERAQSKDAPRKVFSSVPLPLAFIRKIDATVSLSAKRCFLPRLALTRLSATAALKKGRLTLAPVTAVTGGGTLSLTADLRHTGRSLSLSTHVSIRDMNAGQVQEDLGLPRRLEGKMDVDVRLDGRGRSVADIMGSATGHVSVIMGKGKLNNSLFSRFGGSMQDGLTRLFTPDNRDTTDITCMVAHFAVKDGLADATALVMDTPHLAAAGEGSINLKTEALNMDVTPVLKEGLGASGIGRITMSFTELAKPLELGGTLADPTIEVNATDTAITIGKAIGGFTLFGPFGLAAALVGTSGGDDNPCVAAIRTAKAGRQVKPPKKTAPPKKKDSKSGLMESIGKKLKSWFGD
ncbi:MAG: AsmA family protein [Pseudomonadota bacterium]